MLSRAAITLLVTTAAVETAANRLINDMLDLDRNVTVLHFHEGPSFELTPEAIDRALAAMN